MSRGNQFTDTIGVGWCWGGCELLIKCHGVGIYSGLKPILGSLETGLDTVLKALGDPIPAVDHFVGRLMGSL